MFYKGVKGEYFQLKVASANDIINPSDEGFSIECKIMSLLEN